MIKQIAISLMSLFLGVALSAQTPSSQPSTQASVATTQPTSQPAKLAPIMSFETMMIELGDVKRGEVKEFEFPFMNTGTSALKIDLVSSCDCTTTDYPKREVAAGEGGTIKVVFDSTEKEESEVIDIDIFLQNEDPETGAPIIVMLQYSYNLIK